MLHVFFYCVILCFKLHERTYTWCDGYGNYMQGVMRMGKGYVSTLVIIDKSSV